MEYMITNLNLIMWVTVNVLALLYFLYLGKRGRSIVTNIVPLCEKLESQEQQETNPIQKERIQNILHASVKTLYVGFLYSLVSLIGLIMLAVLNLLLMS